MYFSRALLVGTKTAKFKAETPSQMQSRKAELGLSTCRLVTYVAAYICGLSTTLNHSIYEAYWVFLSSSATTNCKRYIQLAGMYEELAKSGL